MKYRPKVYSASKIWRAELWRDLTALSEFTGSSWSHVEFTARWPRMAHLEQDRTVPPTATDFSHFWTIDICDVRRSDFVLLYAGDVERQLMDFPHGEDSESLRGGLVESGAAIALGKTVVAVGLGTNHTWANHPLVVKLPTLEEARNFFFRYHV